MVNLEYGYSNTCIDDININNKGVLSLSLNIKIRIHGISDSGKLCREYFKCISIFTFVGKKYENNNFSNYNIILVRMSSKLYS